MLLGRVRIVLLPLAAGRLLHALLGACAQRTAKVLLSLSGTASRARIGAVVAGSHGRLASLGLLTLLKGVLHNALGLAGGYRGERLLGFDEVVCRLAITVGMRNSGLAAALGKAFSGPLAALPGALFSI